MEDMTEILDTWARQRSKIAAMDEAELKSLLSLELKGRGRSAVVTPIHQRICKLRTNREREAIMARAEKARARYDARKKR